MNKHEKIVGIDPKNDSNHNFKHQSMTVDFDPFWTFKMFGDPLLLIGDPQNLSLVTPWSYIYLHTHLPTQIYIQIHSSTFLYRDLPKHIPVLT